MRRALPAAALLAILLFPAGSALAQSLSGGCTVQATSDLDRTTMTDATRANPFDIDPEGQVSWNASSPAAIRNHTWVINVDLGGLGVAVARGSDPNDAGTLSSVGSRTIADLVAIAEAAGVPNARLLGSLRGIYRVFGEITGEGGSCSGDAYVRLSGNPLSEPVGQVAAAVAALGAIMTIGAGVAKKP